MANWFKRPTKTELIYTLRTLSNRKRYWLGILLALLLAAIVGLGWLVNDFFSVTIPARGGTLREGVIGAPLYINPLLATSDSDRDLTMLIYSGLMRIGPDGRPFPDLAEKYEATDDGLTYTFFLKKNLKWQDGTPLTAEDVAFTVTKAQDPQTKSPRRASWEGVNVTVLSPTLVRFQLQKPYPSFLTRATMGLLPKHLWNKFSGDAFSLNQLNTDPIGSGPYSVKRISKNKDTGIPDYYELRAFSDFALGTPFVSTLHLNFYANEADLVQAYYNRQIDSLNAVSSEHAAELEQNGAHVFQTPLPRVFGVFFNHNQAPVLLHPEVRAALNAAIDRRAIIESTLHGYGTAAFGPLPPTASIGQSDEATSLGSSTNRLAEARQILSDHGWQWNDDSKTWQKQKNKKETETLAFSISTSDAPELREAAELIQQTWQALGAQVELKVYEIGDLTKDVIRPRDYDSLFFGQVLGRSPDLYSFWHSSQRQDPGNNIALYTNADVDKLLDQLRTENDPQTAAELYQKINNYIQADLPAVFVYSPDFLYLLPDWVHGVNLEAINLPSDRFLSVYHWYIATEKVWKIFAPPALSN